MIKKILIASVIGTLLASCAAPSPTPLFGSQQDIVRARIQQANEQQAALDAERQANYQAEVNAAKAAADKQRAEAPPPTECQLKSVYVEHVITWRQQGYNENAVRDLTPQLIGNKLDPAWTDRVRRSVYADANLALSNAGRVSDQVYQECEAQKSRSATSATQPGVPTKR